MSGLSFASVATEGIESENGRLGDSGKGCELFDPPPFFFSRPELEPDPRPVLFRDSYIRPARQNADFQLSRLFGIGCVHLGLTPSIL